MVTRSVLITRGLDLNELASSTLCFVLFLFPFCSVLRVQMARWSSGQDGGLSRPNREFDSPSGHHFPFRDAPLKCILITRGLDLNELASSTLCFVLFLFPFCSVLRVQTLYRVGVYCGEGPPVPIPNTVVKLTCAENTWLATARENRKTPTHVKTPICVGVCHVPP